MIPFLSPPLFLATVNLSKIEQSKPHNNSKLQILGNIGPKNSQRPQTYQISVQSQPQVCFAIFPKSKEIKGRYAYRPTPSSRLESLSAELKFVPNITIGHIDSTTDSLSSIIKSLFNSARTVTKPKCAQCNL